MSLPNIYVPNVPQGNQQINNTQAPIEGNFQDIYDLLAINHIPFNTANTFGKHTFVDYVQQNSDPSTLSTEMALYCKSVTNDPKNLELFYRYPNSGSIVQLTNNGSSSSSSSGLTSGGQFIASGSVPLGGAVTGFWQYLSGGVLFMTFGLSNYVSSSTSSPYTFTFPTGLSTTGVPIPQFTQTPFNMQVTSNITQYNVNVNYAITPTSKTGGIVYYNGPFNVNSTISSIVVTAIGI